MNNFRDELITLINHYDRNVESNTSKETLADYLIACLNAFNAALRQHREGHDA